MDTIMAATLPPHFVTTRHFSEPLCTNYAFSFHRVSLPLGKNNSLGLPCGHFVNMMPSHQPNGLSDCTKTILSRSSKHRHPGVISAKKTLSVVYALYDGKGRARGTRLQRDLKSRASLGGDGDAVGGTYDQGVAEDYYSLLGLTPDCTPDEIKMAYYSCMKTCHPDVSGNRPDVNDFCMFINEVYEVLSDPEQRLMYDEINGYTITAINPFKDTSTERDYTFVDEFTCIGCKNCAHTEPKTFEIEELFGRARVASQCGNPALVERAIQTCPVDCIYWVTPAQLALLEDEMRLVERVNVGLMLSGMGYQSPDVFALASWKWEKRQSRAVERARVRMMKESGKDGKAWWTYHWGATTPENDGRAAADKYAKDRAAKTAAAARRWREFSRQGLYRKPIANLPSRVQLDSEEDEVDKKEKAGINN